MCGDSVVDLVGVRETLCDDAGMWAGAAHIDESGARVVGGGVPSWSGSCVTACVGLCFREK